VVEEEVEALTDVTLTSDVANKQLPVQPEAAETVAMETDSVPAANMTAAAMDQPDLPVGHKGSSGLQKPLIETENQAAVSVSLEGGSGPGKRSAATENEATVLLGHEDSSGLREPPTEVKDAGTVYIDITGCSFEFRRLRSDYKLTGDKRDPNTKNKEQQKTHEGENYAKADTAKSVGVNVETTQQETVQAEAKVGENWQLWDQQNAVPSAVDGVSLAAEMEVKRIELPESEEDGLDSARFSTCSEWLESPTSVKFPLLTYKDSVAGIPEPDTFDSLPSSMIPSRFRGLSAGAAQSAEAARWPYAIPKAREEERTTCFRRTRDLDRNAAADTPTIRSILSTGGSSSTAQKPSIRRPHSAVSPGAAGGRISHQAGRSHPLSKSPLRPIPAEISHTFAVASDSASSARSTKPSLLHQRERPRIPKQCSQPTARKPAWK